VRKSNLTKSEFKLLVSLNAQGVRAKAIAGIIDCAATSVYVWRKFKTWDDFQAFKKEQAKERLAKTRKEKSKTEVGSETKEQSAKLPSMKYLIDVSLNSIAESLRELVAIEKRKEAGRQAFYEKKKRLWRA